MLTKLKSAFGRIWFCLLLGVVASIVNAINDDMRVLCHLTDDFSPGRKLTRDFETTTPCSVVPETLRDEFQRARHNHTVSMKLVRKGKQVANLFQLQQLDGSLISKYTIDR